MRVSCRRYKNTSQLTASPLKERSDEEALLGGGGCALIGGGSAGCHFFFCHVHLRLTRWWRKLPPHSSVMWAGRGGGGGGGPEWCACGGRFSFLAHMELKSEIAQFQGRALHLFIFFFSFYSPPPANDCCWYTGLGNHIVPIQELCQPPCWWGETWILRLDNWTLFCFLGFIFATHGAGSLRGCDRTGIPAFSLRCCLFTRSLMMPRAVRRLVHLVLFCPLSKGLQVRSGVSVSLLSFVAVMMMMMRIISALMAS